MASNRAKAKLVKHRRMMRLRLKVWKRLASEKLLRTEPHLDPAEHRRRIDEMFMVPRWDPALLAELLEPSPNSAKDEE